MLLALGFATLSPHSFSLLLHLSAHPTSKDGLSSLHCCSGHSGNVFLGASVFAQDASWPSEESHALGGVPSLPSSLWDRGTSEDSRVDSPILNVSNDGRPGEGLTLENDFTRVSRKLSTCSGAPFGKNMSGMPNAPHTHQKSTTHYKRA